MKNCALLWWQTWNKVTSKPCGLRWGPTNRMQQDEEKWCSPKAWLHVPFVVSCCFEGMGHQQSLNLNDFTDRGVDTSPYLLSRDQEEVLLNEAWATNLVGSQGGHKLYRPLTLGSAQLASVSSLNVRDNPSFSMSSVETSRPGLFLQEVSPNGSPLQK